MIQPLLLPLHASQANKVYLLRGNGGEVRQDLAVRSLGRMPPNARAELTIITYGAELSIPLPARKGDDDGGTGGAADAAVGAGVHSGEQLGDQRLGGGQELAQAAAAASANVHRVGG